MERDDLGACFAGDATAVGLLLTDFREDDTNVVQWPIPNVLGVRMER